MNNGGPPAPRPGFRRRLQSSVTVPGAVAGGLMVVLIIVLIIVGRTAPAVQDNGLPAAGASATSSPTPLFTAPSVPGVTGSGSSATASPSATAGSPSATGAPPASVSFAATPTPRRTPTPTASLVGCTPSGVLPTPCP